MQHNLHPDTLSMVEELKRQVRARFACCPGCAGKQLRICYAMRQVAEVMSVIELLPTYALLIAEGESAVALWKQKERENVERN